MPADPADLTLSCRWMLPMTLPGAVLENHALVVRDGRIIDLLPAALAAARYAAAVHIERPRHALLPGLIDAGAELAPLPGHGARSERLHDAVQLGIAALLKTGVTAFCSLGNHPEAAARGAAEQGMRALIGIPIADTAGVWAAGADDYLSRALRFRDDYRGHPTIATAFAPDVAATGDLTFGRIATLADELEAGILVALHASQAQLEQSLAQYGKRPLDRLQALGLLTPSLTALHMTQVDADDVARAERGGIALVLCPQADLRAGNGPPPITVWHGSGLRLGMGSGNAPAGSSLDMWSELKLFALLARASAAGRAPAGPWDALTAVTRGAAAALGLDAEIGTLEAGKWADLCCVDVSGPGLQWAGAAAGTDLAEHLVFNGDRDLVSDVWVAGRHLLNDGQFTRLDWPQLMTRVQAWRKPPVTGD